MEGALKTLQDSLLTYVFVGVREHLAPFNAKIDSPATRVEKLTSKVEYFSIQFSSSVDSCKTQAKSKKRRHDNSNDLDHHEGEKRPRVESITTTTVIQAQVHTTESYTTPEKDTAKEVREYNSIPVEMDMSVEMGMIADIIEPTLKNPEVSIHSDSVLEKVDIVPENADIQSDPQTETECVIVKGSDTLGTQIEVDSKTESLLLDIELVRTRNREEVMEIFGLSEDDVTKAYN